MAKRAKPCPSRCCTPAQQARIVAQVERQLAKCGTPPAPRKASATKSASTTTKPPRAASALDRLAATVAEHEQRFRAQATTNRKQDTVNRVFAGAIASIYQVVATPADVRRAPRGPFSTSEAQRAARAIGAPARGIPARALAVGMTEELEHGTRAGVLDVTHDDATVSARIALAHMRGDPAYYRHLAAMEASARQGVRQLPAPSPGRRDLEKIWEGDPRYAEAMAPKKAPRKATPKGLTQSARVMLVPYEHGRELHVSQGWLPLNEYVSTYYEAAALAAKYGRKAYKRPSPELRELEDDFYWIVRVHPIGTTRPRAKRARVDVEAVEQTVEQLESDPFAVPQPIGPENYRPPQCATHHEPWSDEYELALEEARERAAIEAGEDDDEFRRLLRKYFSEHPRFANWSETERECVKQFRSRHGRKRRRTETASTETARAIADASAELGYDVRGSAEHLDRMTLGGQASYWRRLHKKTGSVDALRRARELERRNRARKRKGAGVETFAAG